MRHVAELVLVALGRPAVGSLGEKLLVIVLLIDRVKEVLQVIECDRNPLRCSAVLCIYDSEREREQADQPSPSTIVHAMCHKLIVQVLEYAFTKVLINVGLPKVS